MNPFSLVIVLALLYAIVLQFIQFFDFSEDRSLTIEVLYIAIIVALILTTDFLKFK